MFRSALHHLSLRRVTASVFTAALVTLASVVLLPQVAGATSDSVTNCNGSGAGSLPAVVAGATNGETITFAVACPSSSPITLSNTIDIQTNLTIAGPGASSVVVSGNHHVQVFSTGSQVTTTISGITIENGHSAQDGGGIQNNGTLTLMKSTVSGNVADSGGGISSGDSLANELIIVNSTIANNQATGLGGGISIEGPLSITYSTFVDNSAEFGGGIEADPSSDHDPVITDSLVTGNTATEAGGGIYGEGDGGSGCGGGGLDIEYSTVSGNNAVVGGGADSVGAALHFSNSTISNNVASSNGGGIAINCGDSEDGDESAAATVLNSTVANNSATNGEGGGIWVAGGEFGATWSTIAGNAAESGGGIYTATNSEIGASTLGETIVANSSSGGDCNKAIGGSYNLDDDGSCGFTAANHGLSGVDPELGPLANNGGPTETEAPQLGSPVVDAVSACSTNVDQRGVSRPQGSACDIGAVELSVPMTIVSANVVTADVRKSSIPFLFVVTTIGSPSPVITETGALPKGLTFTRFANGTATIAGAVGPKAIGTYPMTFTATFGTGSSRFVVTQNFTLNVVHG